MLAEAQAAQQNNAIIDQMRDEMRSWQPGKYAPFVQNIKSALDFAGQAVGVKPDQSVGDWQTFNKNAMQIAAALEDDDK